MRNSTHCKNAAALAICTHVVINSDAYSAHTCPCCCCCCFLFELFTPVQTVDETSCKSGEEEGGGVCVCEVSLSFVSVNMLNINPIPLFSPAWFDKCQQRNSCYQEKEKRSSMREGGFSTSYFSGCFLSWKGVDLLRPKSSIVCQESETLGAFEITQAWKLRVMMIKPFSVNTHDFSGFLDLHLPFFSL